MQSIKAPATSSSSTDTKAEDKTVSGDSTANNDKKAELKAALEKQLQSKIKEIENSLRAKLAEKMKKDTQPQQSPIEHKSTYQS